jgi:UPF0755 protein
MSKRQIIIGIIILCVAAVAALFYMLFFSAPAHGTSAAGATQFTVAQNATSTAAAVSNLRTQGFIKSDWAFDIALYFRKGSGAITPGGYEISTSMNAWQIAGVLAAKPALVWVVIPEGLRKEEIAAILAQDLGWTSAQESEWINVDTTTNPDYIEGVYFPDTYLIPVSETPAQVAQRLQAEFETQFAPYAAEALKDNIKWTTALTMASIIQREAATPSDMALISGILWNRLLTSPPMKLQVDSTVQYARGDTPTGWWAPITPADESINSPYNTYLNAGLPPHPISNPGLDAINAALNPASTSCLYYISDASGTIHCSDTYAGQEANIQEYLQ